MSMRVLDEDDLYNEGIIGALRGMREWSESGSEYKESTYVYRAIQRGVLDAIRRCLPRGFNRNTVHFKVRFVSKDDILQEIESPYPDQIETAEWNELRSYRFTNKRHQQVFDLLLQGYRHGEIAHKLNLSKNRIHQIKLELRKKLQLFCSQP